VPARETRRLRPHRGVSLFCGSFMANQVQIFWNDFESVNF